MQPPTRQALVPIWLLLALATPGAAQRSVLRVNGAATPGSLLGFALAGPGDVDGGGRDDALIGAPGLDQVSLHFGEGGSDTIFGPAGTGFGSALCGLDDVAGDARLELAVGAPADASAGVDAGSVHVVQASGASVYVIFGAAAGARFGAALASIADLDQDGVRDLLVGAPGDGPGSVSLLSGASGNLITSWLGASSSAANGDAFGAALCAVADRDGDGLEDVLVGAPGWWSAAGRVELRSSASGATLDVFYGALGDEVGASVARLGDVDLDGVEELLLGAPQSSAGAGFALLVSGASGAAIQLWQGVGRFGASVSGAGDFDGDGFADVIVGAPDREQGRGEARVFSGASGELLAVFGGFHNDMSAGPGTGVGASVAFLGQFDGVGGPEVLVGGPNESHFQYGSFHGYAAAFSRRPGVSVRLGPALSPPGPLGRSLRFVGDVDGDGRADFASSPPVELRSGADGALLRWIADAGRVAAAGDVDGDSIPDVLVIDAASSGVYSSATGALLLSLPGAQAGEGGLDVDGDTIPDVLLGSATQALVLSGADGSTIFQVALSTLDSSLPADPKHVALLTDITGDGRAEVLIGEPRHQTAHFNLGRLSLYSGTGALLFQLENPTFVFQFGISVCDAGDFDGDGVHDFAVAAESEETLSVFGQVQVYSGASQALLYDSGERQLNRWGLRSARGFGFELRSAGDLDLDGKAELLIANPFEYGAGFNLWAAGEVLVVHGGDGSSYQLEPAFEGYDRFGFSLDGGMDASGDGLPDLLLGAPADLSNNDGALTSEARVLLVDGLLARSLVQSYCESAPNSVFAGARIGASGSTSLAVNDLVLEVARATPLQNGLFFGGPASGQTPFGDGYRCVFGSALRFNPPMPTSAALGLASRAIDLSSPPANAIGAGSTWYFQFWYRDPLGPGGSGFNLSDGLAASFRP